MYIRTKNGVYKIDEIKPYFLDEKQKLFINNELKVAVNEQRVINQSDTLEELCDEFCYIKDDIVSQYLTIDFKFKRDDEFCALRNKLTANGIAEISKGISKYELQVGKLKCAIWTSKGLIYIAKMNDTGELELI